MCDKYYLYLGINNEILLSVCVCVCDVCLHCSVRAHVSLASLKASAKWEARCIGLLLLMSSNDVLLCLPGIQSIYMRIPINVRDLMI